MKLLAEYPGKVLLKPRKAYAMMRNAPPLLPSSRSIPVGFHPTQPIKKGGPS